LLKKTKMREDARRAHDECSATEAALRKAEEDVATRRGARVLHQQTTGGGDAPARRRLQGRGGVANGGGGGADGGGDGVGADPLLIKRDKAMRDHEVALTRALTRISDVAVKHARREELVGLKNRLTGLVQRVRGLLDAPKGAASSELTNARVREVRCTSWTPITSSLP
jgi:hypothetical protein